MLVSAVSNFVNTPYHGVRKVPSKPVVTNVSDDFARRKIKLATSLAMSGMFLACILMSARKNFLGMAHQRHLYLLT